MNLLTNTEKTTNLDSRSFALNRIPHSSRSNGLVDSSVTRSVNLMGVTFDKVNFEGALEQIERMIESRKSHYVVTANVDFLVQARRDAELHQILASADLVLCDGTPLLWASRLLGTPLPERVAGSDLAPHLIRMAAKRRYRLFLLGAEADSCAEAAARLRAEFPDLEVAHYSPPFVPLHLMNHQEIRDRILTAQPDLLFISFGCPKAEKWMAMNTGALHVPVMIGVGGTIDFLAGRFRRAPIWMRKAGLEWVFRLLQEPRRLFRRYATDMWSFGWAFLAEFWKRKFQAIHPVRANNLSAGSK